MKIRGARRLASSSLLSAVACALCACQGGPPGQSPSAPAGESVPATVTADGSSLLPVPVPDLSRRDEDVRRRLLEIRAELDRAMGQDLEPVELGRRFARAGMHYHAHGLLQAAAACYRNARQLSPSDYRFSYFLGHVLRAGGDSDGAARELRRSLDLNPDYVATYVVLAELLQEENRMEEAASLLERALRLAPDAARVHIGLGRTASAGKAFAKAVDHFETALRIEPEATEIHYPLGLAYRGLGDLERARIHLEKRGSVKASLDDPLMAELSGLGGGSHWHAKRGTAAFQMGRYEEAAREFRVALDADPDNLTARVNFAATLVRLADVEGALEQFREAARIDPTHARARFGVGTMLVRLGRDEEAVDHFVTAVALDEGMLDAHFNLANALRRLGRFEEAEPHYGRVAEMDPRNGTARYAQALSLIRLARWEDAVTCLEAGHEALPEFLPVKDALARLLAAAPVESLRDGSRALRMAEELYREENSIFHVETLAMALAEAGRFDEAVANQERALAAAVNAGRTDLSGRIEANLVSYRAGRPCRTPWPEDDPVLNP